MKSLQSSVATSPRSNRATKTMMMQASTAWNRAELQVVSDSDHPPIGVRVTPPASQPRPLPGGPPTGHKRGLFGGTPGRSRHDDSAGQGSHRNWSGIIATVVGPRGNARLVTGPGGLPGEHQARPQSRPPAQPDSGAAARSGHGGVRP
jgi:hypothetical protein